MGILKTLVDLIKGEQKNETNNRYTVELREKELVVKKRPTIANSFSHEKRIEQYKKEIDEMSVSEIDALIQSLATAPDLLAFNTENIDPMLAESARLIVIHQQGSTSLIQRKLKLGYNRAGRIIDQLEMAGIVGPFEGSKNRDVLIVDLQILEDLLKQFSIGSYKSLTVTKISLFYEKYKSEIEKIQAENSINEEKELVKQELLEKERKRQLKRQVLSELKNEGIIKNNSIGERRRRETIPQDVLDSVWNRDSGKCVQCDSQDNLEFDHIIPFSKGGSNTYRNLQLLCKQCNLEKSNKIG